MKVKRDIEELAEYTTAGWMNGEQYRGDCPLCGHYLDWVDGERQIVCTHCKTTWEEKYKLIFWKFLLTF